MKLLLIAFTITYCVLGAGGAYAQDPGYAPPPMFDEPAPLPPPVSIPPRQSPAQQPVRQDGRALVAPRVSPRVDLSRPAVPHANPTAGTVKKMAPILEKRTSAQVTRKEKEKEKEKAVPVPPKKPGAPEQAAKIEVPATPAPVTVKTPEAKKTSTTATAKHESNAPQVTAKPIAPKPASVVKHEGYVTGPKTMPAVPTQSVDAVAVFSPEEDQGLTILERHQRQEKAKKDEVKKVAEDKAAAKKLAEEQAAAPPEGYEKTAQDALKKILPYEAGAMELAQPDMKAVADGIASELSKRPQWRVQIRSYASGQDGTLGSDKRIALGRAMSLRKSLLDQGVAPDKIDLRAEGKPTDATQLDDRIDLYLFGPAKTAEKR